MKARKINMIGWMILFSSLPSLAADTAVAPPYLGQEPPGLLPKVFAPGLLGIPNRIENDICLSQDGRECYFTSRTAGWTVYEIMVTRYENGQWTPPARASFSDSRSLGPCLADNDQTIYFGRSGDLWRARRTAQGWSQPEVVAAPVSSPQADYTAYMSTLGNLWTCSWRTGGFGGCDVWRVSFANGQFQVATNLSTLNAPANECSPMPGPDEKYVLFNSDRPGGFGGGDLYISFADGQGGWTAPRNLGPTINSSRSEWGPCLSVDGKYLFFSRDDTAGDSSLYWVRVEAFLPDPNGPVFNLTTGAAFRRHPDCHQSRRVGPGDPGIARHLSREPEPAQYPFDDPFRQCPGFGGRIPDDPPGGQELAGGDSRAGLGRAVLTGTDNHRRGKRCYLLRSPAPIELVRHHRPSRLRHRGQRRKHAQPGSLHRGGQRREPGCGPCPRRPAEDRRSSARWTSPSVPLSRTGNTPWTATGSP